MSIRKINFAIDEYYHNSSYLDYLKEDRIRLKILNKKEFPKYFLSENSFKEETYDWLNFTP